MTLDYTAQGAMTLLRYMGFLAYFLIFAQLILSKYVKNKLWYYFSYFWIAFTIGIHLLSYVFYIFRIKGVLDFFYPITDLCFLCRNIQEHYINFGRIALWIFIGSLFFTFFKKIKIYVLNYLIFFFASLHFYSLAYVPKTTLGYFYWGTNLIIITILFLDLKAFLSRRAKLQK